MTLRSLAPASLLACTLLLPISGNAQGNISPQANGAATPSKTFPIDQIVTASVHDAWLLSGKDEAVFFDIVQQLATISAEKRGVTLPDSAAAGRRMGVQIKAAAKTDHDQLLYVVVDKAVRTVGTKNAATQAAAK